MDFVRVLAGLLCWAIAAVAQAETVAIQVRHLAAGAGWEVRYRLAEPAGRLQFFGDFGDRRRAHWRIETPGLRWQTVTDDQGQPHDAVVAADGARLDAITLRFASDGTKLPHRYPLNRRFSDGSEWLYTGHLYAAPMREGVPEREARMQLQLVPISGEGVELQGRRLHGPLDWREPDPELRGAFAYFGRLPAVESPAARVIADPSLPPYLGELFANRYPELLRYYTERTGHPLTRRATVLIAFQPDRDGSDLDGNALPGSFDLNFQGRGWREDSPDTRRRAFEFIAHESAHLWNGDRFASKPGDAAPWMHEGGAEAFAWLAMRHLGLLDAAGLKDRAERAIYRCQRDLGAGGLSLKTAFQQGHYHLGYSCGAAMNLLAGAALQDRGGLFALWRSVFQLSASTGRRYDTEQYFVALEQLAGNARMSRLLRQLWAGPQPDAGFLFDAALQQLGIVASAVPAPADETGFYPGQVMAGLMAADCGGSVNLWNAPDGLRVGGLPGCTVLKDAEVRVVGIAGQPVPGDGGAVYAAVAARCAAGQAVPVQVADRDQPLSLACGVALPPLPTYRTLDRWPESD